LTVSRYIAVFAVCVGASGLLGGIWIARATSPIKPPGLAFTGTLRHGDTPLSGTQTVEFRFKLEGTLRCSSGAITANVDSTGAFQVQVPTDACPPTLFDRGQVTVDVLVAGEVAAQDQPIGAVPYAKYAEHAGIPECPVGYERDASAAGITLCKKGVDEIVRIGTGGSSFWIDRYESSIWERPDGTGIQYSAGTYPSSFPENGQGANDLLVYAISRAKVRPSLGATWFQANRACRASGKRLPNGDEWIEAATGTPDPGAGNGTGGACLTAGNGVRLTGDGLACVSNWGAQDMIGNAWEMTAEWFATVGFSDAGYDLNTRKTWPQNYNGDGTIGIVSLSDPGPKVGLPVVAGRGGAWWDKEWAGVFALSTQLSPTATEPSGGGFRCVTPR
jgi:formylglycine-generating enzyme required for sulfatase activity